MNNLLKIVGLQRIGKILGEQVKRDFTTKKTLRKPGENKRNTFVLKGHTGAGKETKVGIEQKVSLDQSPDLGGGRKVIVWE